MIAPSTSTLFVSLASVIAVSQAAILSPGFTPNDIDRRGLFDGPGALLQARQDNTQPNVPAECLPTCGPVNTLIEQGCPPTSCCTSTFVQGFVTCYQCVAAAAGVTDFSRGQASLHTLVVGCNDRGLPVTEVFFPGQSPSSTTSTTTSTSTEPTVITSQSTVRSLTGPVIPTNTISQNTIRSTDLPNATAPPSTSETAGSNSGALALGGGMAWTTASAWVLPLVAAGMGVVLF